MFYWWVRPGESLPKGENEEEALCLVGTCKHFLFTKNNMETVPSRRLKFKRIAVHP